MGCRELGCVGSPCSMIATTAYFIHSRGLGREETYHTTPHPGRRTMRRSYHEPPVARLLGPAELHSAPAPRREPLKNIVGCAILCARFGTG
jgi:hypothetical protein